MGSPKGSRSESRPTGPFGLRGVALFVLAASVYGSMLASIAALFKGRTPDSWAKLLVALFVILVWAVLLPIYRYWGLRIVVRIHCAAPAVMLLVMLLPLVFLRMNLVLTVMAFACAASSLVSFPTAVVILLHNARKRFRQARSLPAPHRKQSGVPQP
jgi:hypothetical protein